MGIGLDASMTNQNGNSDTIDVYQLPLLARLLSQIHLKFYNSGWTVIVFKTNPSQI